MCCFNRERKHCFGSQLNALVPSFLTFWLVCSARTELAKLLLYASQLKCTLNRILNGILF